MADKSFSRRTFLVGGATLLSSLFLPRVEGTQDAFLVVAPGAEAAYAAEPDASADTDILVVSRTELGVVVFDVTDPATRTVVPGAKVKLTSRSQGGKTLEATVNDQGSFIFDILELAEDPDAETPAFNGSLEITCDGYRDVIIPLTRVTAHAAIAAPTRPLDEKPYFRTLTMNEWDVEYTEATFMTSRLNEEDHLIEAVLCLPREGSVVNPTLTITNEDGTEHTQTADPKVNDDGTVTLSFTGKYLRTREDLCIDEKSSAKVSFQISDDNKSLYSCDLHVLTKPVPIDDVRKADTLIIPGMQSGGSIKPIVLPDTFVPPFAGASLSLWAPKLPVLYDFSPFGYGLLGVDIEGVWARGDNGEDAGWKRVPTSSITDQLEAQKTAQEKAVENFLAADATPSSGYTYTSSITSKLEPTAHVQAYASLTHSWEKSLWTGSVNGVLGGDLNYTWTYQMSFMGFPFYLQVNPHGSLYATVRGGIAMQEIPVPDFTGQKLTVGGTLNLGLGLSVGVGIAGFISASVTGAGYLSFLANIGADDPDARFRFIIGAGASVAMTIQWSLYKITLPIWSDDWPKLFDSKYDALADGDGDTIDLSGTEGQRLLTDAVKARLGQLGLGGDSSFSGGALPTFAELKARAKIVTNEELLESREFELDRALQADLASARVVDEKPQLGDIENLGDLAPTIVVPADGYVAGLGDSLEAALAAGADNYLPTYRYVGERGASFTGTPGVKGICDDRRGGVIPTVDNLLFKNVNSDPDLVLLTIKPTNRTVLFRVASVDVGGGNARTRLVYHVLKDDKTWSDPWVVNFDSQILGVSRDDMYDYEFDVCQAEGKDGVSYVYVLVTSGVRPEGDDTPLEQGVKASYVSLVGLYDSYTDDEPLYCDPTMTCALKGSDDGYTIIGPRVTGFSSKLSVVGTCDFCVMGTYQVRKLDSEQGIMDAGGAIYFFARLEWDSSYEQRVFRVDYNAFAHGSRIADDYALFPVKIDDDDYDWGYGSVANDRRMSFAALLDGSVKLGKFDAIYKDHDTTQFQGIVSSLDFVNYGNWGDEPKVCRAYPWGDDGEMVFTAISKNDAGDEFCNLYHMSFDGKGGSEYTVKKISDDDASVADFVVDPGHNFLFYVQNKEGKTGQGYDDDYSVDPDGEVMECHHYIMAVAHVNGGFTKPFVFAELGHVVDNLVAATINDSYVTFVASSITDIDRSLADLYDARVPLLKCLTPTSLVMTDPFAFSGEDCSFDAWVRNDGNLVAIAATFTLFEEDGSYVDDMRVRFIADEAVQAASEDEEDDRGPLLPGMSRAVHLTFAIPEDWHDEKNVYVQVSDIEVINPTSAANPSFAEFHVEAERCPLWQVELNDGVTVDTSALADGLVSVKRVGDDGNGGGDDGNGGASGGSGSEKREAIPNTGDSSFGGAALATLGTLGAAIALRGGSVQD
jgi:hypothetical protein